ncbi:hypothetical protein FQN51_004225 [Onygenales sp. PD_10]|nr:hypothetical protein FQN51_004225 [Onygenales sp. PD_10]
MATTPPPRTIRTPPTPRHGARFDPFEPYSTRQSARLAKRHTSRGSPGLSTPSSPDSLTRADLSTDGQKCHNNPNGFSPPQSAQNSPARRSPRTAKDASQDTQRHSLFDNTRRQTSHLFHSTAETANNSSKSSSRHTTLTANMLPTPAKTPRKKTVPNPSAVARTLFNHRQQHLDPEMPTPKRQKGKKFKGFSLESFNAELDNEEKDKIVIFTDSRDRIPEVHETADNPFISRPDEAEPSTPDTADEGQGTKRDEKVEEALHREDGMLYVFRGKKTFRKFNSDTDEEDETDLGLLASRPDLLDGPLPRVRPLTRSSIKPRLLFPGATQRATRVSKVADAGKTAESDMGVADEPNQASPQLDIPNSSSNTVPVTPPSKTTVSTPATPLATGRSLRSHTREAQDDVGTPSREAVRVSPFDKWTRTKAQASPAKLRKRIAAASADNTEPAAKRTRSN